MAQTSTRITATLIALAFPVSTLAYSINYFSIDSPEEELSEEVLEQQRDTKCREKLGFPGGDMPYGAQRFLLRRCINTLKQAEVKERRQKSRMSRIEQNTQKRIQQTQQRISGALKFTRRTLSRQIDIRKAFQKGIPQTSVEQERSFRTVRSRRRISVQAQEQIIRRTQNKRSLYIRDAREACAGVTAGQERSTCVSEKLKELMGE